MILAIGTATPRDNLDKLIAFFLRSLRYWWLVGIIGAIGMVLTTMLAIKAPRKYVSEATVFYNERLNTSLLQGRDFMMQTKNLGDRYREFIMARQQLAKVVTELELLPEVVKKDGVDVAVEELKDQKLVTFRVLGTNMFKIEFQAPEPDQAQAVVTMLTEILIAEDRRIRRESAEATKNFLVEQKAKHDEEMNAATEALATFLKEHPEFAEEQATGQQAVTGAAVRAAKEGKVTEPPLDTSNMDPRLVPLERQRRRLKARLDAPVGQVSAQPQDSPERQQALEEVRRAKRELEQAKQDLDAKLTQLQPLHPDVRRAEKRVEDAQRRVQQAEAEVPTAIVATPVAPIDRSALEEQLRTLERQIATTKAEIRAEKKGGDAAPEASQEAETAPEEPEENDENWVVKLETRHSRLVRAVQEAQRRVSDADAKLNNAQISAEQQMAEEGGVLSIIDPASRPAKPQGKSPIFLIAAGTLAFLVLGAGLALALALVDDRIYTAGDLEGLKIAPVMVVIPKPPKGSNKIKGSRRGK